MEKPATADFPQYSLAKAFALHVLPGILTAAAFMALKPLLEPIGYRPLLAFLLAVLLVDLPVLLGMMLYQGKRGNGHYNFTCQRGRLPKSWRLHPTRYRGAH